MDKLTKADPEIPQEITDRRDQDNWRHLFAVADAAGGRWSKVVRENAVQWLKHSEADLKGFPLLVAACLHCFRSDNSKRISTEELLERLKTFDNEELKKLTAYTLPKHFKDYNLGAKDRPAIKSKNLRISGIPKQGYEVEPFEKAFEVYCKKEDLGRAAALDGRFLENPPHPQHINDFNDLGHDKSLTHPRHGPDTAPDLPHRHWLNDDLGLCAELQTEGAIMALHCVYEAYMSNGPATSRAEFEGVLRKRGVAFDNTHAVIEEVIKMSKHLAPVRKGNGKWEGINE